jgi:hypothetical protein
MVEGIVIDPATRPFARGLLRGPRAGASMAAMPDDPETLTLRPTVIAGHRCEDDFAVIWRGRSIGRIRKASGAPHDTAQ